MYKATMKWIRRAVLISSNSHAACGLELFFLMCAVNLAAGTPPLTVDSPEVQADRRVTFRFLAPNAKDVVLQSEFAWSTSMKKDNDGIWSVTAGPLEPDLYAYWFTVDDGVPVLDPANSWVRPNLHTLWNLVRVPGSVPLLWDVQDAPHGRRDLASRQRQQGRSRTLAAVHHGLSGWTPDGGNAASRTVLSD